MIIWNLSLTRVLDDTASMVCTSRCWTRYIVLRHWCTVMLELSGFILAWVNRIDSGVRSSCLLGILLGCLLLASLTFILLITRSLFKGLSLLVIDLWITISRHYRWLLSKMSKLVWGCTTRKTVSKSWLLHFIWLEMMNFLVLGIGCTNGLFSISYSILDHDISIRTIWIHGVTLVSANLLLSITCRRNTCRALIGMTYSELQELFYVFRWHFGRCTVTNLNHLGFRIVVWTWRSLWWHLLVVPAMVHTNLMSVIYITGLMWIRATWTLSWGYALWVLLAHDALVGHVITRNHALILNWCTLLLIFPTLIGCIPSEKITRFLEVIWVWLGYIEKTI